MFLHASWWHLLGNMLMLWVFGANVEDRLGRIRFLPFFLICGAFAGLAQAFSQPSSTAVVIGASGSDRRAHRRRTWSCSRESGSGR